MNTIPLRLFWLEAILWGQTKTEALSASRKSKKKLASIHRREKTALLKLLS